MTISWLAEKKASRQAAAKTGHSAREGSQTLIARIVRVSSSWIGSIQPRLRPNRRSRPGGVRSISGAHRNFSR